MSRTAAAPQVSTIETPEPGAWSIDPAHTRVGFVARHLMVTKVRGSFEKFEGSVVVGATPEDSSVEVTIQADSIDTAEPKRDAHLRSADFFDVEKFPTLHFRSTKVEQTGETGLAIHGDLTIRGVTRPVTLDASYEGLSQTPWGTTAAGFTARTEIDRDDWGLNWNQALETGGWLVGKKVTIELDVELAR